MLLAIMFHQVCIACFKFRYVGGNRSPLRLSRLSGGSELVADSVRERHCPTPGSLAGPAHPTHTLTGDIPQTYTAGPGVPTRAAEASATGPPRAVPSRRPLLPRHCLHGTAYTLHWHRLDCGYRRRAATRQLPPELATQS